MKQTISRQFWWLKLRATVSLLLVWLTLVALTVLALFAQTRIYQSYAQARHLAASLHVSLPQLLAGYRSLRTYLIIPWWQHYYLPVRQSKAGMQHFAEVKTLVTHLELVTLVLVIISVVIVVRMLKTRTWWQWYLPSCWLVLLLVAAGILVGLNFNQAFVGLHHVLFHDLTWEFDPTTDPIILALPMGYFGLLALLVGAVSFLVPCVVIGALQIKLRK